MWQNAGSIPMEMVTRQTELMVSDWMLPQRWHSASGEISDDPSSRKPLIWPDYSFEDERAHPLGKERPADKVYFNADVFQYHRKLIRIRRENPVLVHGEIEFIKVDHPGELLAYRRFDEESEIIVVFNHHYVPEKVHIPRTFNREYRDILHSAEVEYDADTIPTEIPARTACILKAAD